MFQLSKSKISKIPCNVNIDDNIGKVYRQIWKFKLFISVISKLSDLLYEIIWPTNGNVEIFSCMKQLKTNEVLTLWHQPTGTHNYRPFGFIFYIFTFLFLFDVQTVYPRGVIVRQLWYEKLEIENTK